MWKEKLTIVIRRRCVFVVVFKRPEKNKREKTLTATHVESGEST